VNPLATVLVVVLLVSGMVAMGTSTTVTALRALARKPGALALGIGLNLVVIPAIAFALLRALELEQTTALALMIVAAAPGGGTGALLSLHVRGDRAHAVALQVALAVTSLVAAPLWLRLYAGPDGAGDIHAGPLVEALLVLQWLPLGIGLTLSSRRPAVADAVHPRARRFADLMLAALIVVLVVTSGSKIGENGGDAFVGIALVLALTLAAGLAAAIGTAAVRRATAMTTLIRNLSLALAATAFMKDSEAAALVVLTYGLAMYLTGVGWILLDRARPTGRRPRSAGTP
jgi:BASS family bile acid:Na+ symporter